MNFAEIGPLCSVEDFRSTIERAGKVDNTLFLTVIALSLEGMIHVSNEVRAEIEAAIRSQKDEYSLQGLKEMQAKVAQWKEITTEERQVA